MILFVLSLVKPDVEGVHVVAPHLATGIVVFNRGINLVLNHAEFIVVQDTSALETILEREIILRKSSTVDLDTKALDELINVVENAEMREMDANSVANADDTILRGYILASVLSCHLVQHSHDRLDVEKFLDTSELCFAYGVTELNPKFAGTGFLVLDRKKFSVLKVVLKIVFKLQHTNHPFTFIVYATTLIIALFK
jgi:hypothetical protein